MMTICGIVMVSVVGALSFLLQEDEIKALGMGAYMGVAQGAVFPPKFIHLTYK